MLAAPPHTCHVRTQYHSRRAEKGRLLPGGGLFQPQEPRTHRAAQAAGSARPPVATSSGRALEGTAAGGARDQFCRTRLAQDPRATLQNGYALGAIGPTPGRFAESLMRKVY